VFVGLPTTGVHGKHCDVLFVHRLKVHGVNGQHLDGAPAAGPGHNRLMSLWATLYTEAQTGGNRGLRATRGGGSRRTLAHFP
jgi:hypothetical protein